SSRPAFPWTDTCHFLKSFRGLLFLSVLAGVYEMNTNHRSAGSLHGCRVVDLSRVLGGPYCTQILADHGAEVLKIEPPSGDETRGWGPPFLNGTASYFLGVNRNKYGASLDLSQPPGQQALKALL